jgi:hypothetical protein
VSSRFLTGLVALAIASARVGAQQIPPRPAAYESGQGPVIAIDEAHHNTHTLGSPPFRNLIELLRGDGYQVGSLTRRITRTSLSGLDVLVIAGPGGWLTPAESLDEAETSDLLEWVRGGGSLLVLLDHTPAPRNAAVLTRALGVLNWHNGYAMVATDSLPIANIIFWREEFFPAGQASLGATGPGGGVGYQGTDARLTRSVITEGSHQDERVRRVATFVGSAFQMSSPAEPVLLLPTRAISLMPPETPGAVPTMTRTTPSTPVAGWLQGAILRLGRGRVALFGETGLFSAGPAADNRIFVLNVFHWLSGRL